MRKIILGFAAMSSISAFAESTLVDTLLKQKTFILDNENETNSADCPQLINVQTQNNGEVSVGDLLSFKMKAINSGKTVNEKSHDIEYDIYTKDTTTLKADSNSIQLVNRLTYRDGLTSMIYGTFSSNYPVRSKFFDLQESFTLTKLSNGFNYVSISEEKIDSDIRKSMKCKYNNH